MKRLLTLLLPFAACGLAVAAAPPSAQPQPSQQGSPQPQSARAARPQSYSDRYSILTQRNIFLKDRSRGGGGGSSRNGSTTGPTTASTRTTRRPPEETLLLRGIVVEQGEVRAYFEDVANNEIVRVAQGDRIATGRVVGIGLDAVEYEPAAGSGRKSTFVAVGNDLTGHVPAGDLAAGTAAASATTGPVMPTGVEGLNPNDPNLTMEQRLKLRRMQELKK